jgi:hypothetical protein
VANRVKIYRSEPAAGRHRRRTSTQPQEDRMARESESDRAEGPEPAPRGERSPDPLAENPDDDVLPASPRRRHVATAIALFFVAGILLFLVWFIATHTEQREEGAGFGAAVEDANGGEGRLRSRTTSSQG